MAVLSWDTTGERHYETGVSKGVLYPKTSTAGAYNTGVAWSGLVSVSETPSGAEPSPLYADNIKYLTLVSAEELGVTIEAFSYPDEFAVCDGSAEAETGVFVSQQTRVGFGLSYQTKIGTDDEGNDHGYKIHILYGCKAAPSERAYQTINESPEAITFSWEVTTTPELFDSEGDYSTLKPTALIVVDSTAVAAEDLAVLEAALYGTTGTPGTDAELPTPDEVLAMFATAQG